MGHLEREKRLDSGSKIDAALKFATAAHSGMFRKTGEPYITHPVAVCSLLQEWGLGRQTEMLIAALLHDTVEDTSVTIAHIESQFGSDIAGLVDAVSKAQSQPNLVDHETHRKIFQHSYLDPRVAVIKLADRLHNMRTLGVMAPKKQTAKARETMDVYVGLARSLGMWSVKSELEDLAFQYLFPDAFLDTKAAVDSDPRLQEPELSRMVLDLEQLYSSDPGHVKTIARRNSYWNIYSKIQTVSLKNVSDVISYRIIRHDSSSTTGLDALVKNYSKYIDASLTDFFIGDNRRPNGYQAVQLTLSLPEGCLELALVSESQEDFNTRGVLKLIQDGDSNLNAYRQKAVFDETGQIRFLPEKATGVDLTYQIGEQVGNTATGVTIDGQICPLSTILPNSATVSVISEGSVVPLSAKIEHAALADTKKIIAQAQSQQENYQRSQAGKAMLREKLGVFGILRLDELGQQTILKLLSQYGSQSEDELYLRVGAGFIDPDVICTWLGKQGVSKEKLGFTSLSIQGEDKPGIARQVTEKIASLRGNIRHLSSNTVDGRFDMLVVIEGLQGDLEKEKRLKKFLGNQGYFSFTLV